MHIQRRLFGRRGSVHALEEALESSLISGAHNFAKLGGAFPQEGLTKEELKENIVYVRNEVVRWYDSIAWVDDTCHPSVKRILTIPGTLDVVAVPHPVVSGRISIRHRWDQANAE